MQYYLLLILLVSLPLVLQHIFQRKRMQMAEKRLPQGVLMFQKPLQVKQVVVAVKQMVEAVKQVAALQENLISY